MASNIFSSNKTDVELCITCTNKYHRTRSAFCQCKHCSIPFCLDCMREHHDELLLDLESISHEYNQLREVLQQKRTMIVEQTEQSIEAVNQYFERYTQQLHETRRKILENMDQSMENAKNSLDVFERNLRMIGDGIQSVAKEGMVQTSKMQDLAKDFNQIQKQITNYQIVRTENFIQTQPDYSIRFDSISEEIPINQSVIVESNNTTPQEQPMTTWQPSAIPKFPQLIPVETTSKKFRLSNESSSSDNSDSDSDDSIETTYKIDRMASDGQHILYSSQKPNGTDRIVYSLMDDDDEYEDDSYNWKYARIQDMIWWNKIKEFLCATCSGIYTVKYEKEKFKITEVITGKWSDIRLAVNTEHLFVWMKSLEKNFHGIQVYSSKFRSVRNIELEPLLDASQGFSVTDQYIVTSYMKKEFFRDFLQVVCYDLNMQNPKTTTIAVDRAAEQIRTDGKLFFLTVSRTHLWKIDPVELKSSAIPLRFEGKWIEVLQNQRLAISNGLKKIQVINY